MPRQHNAKTYLGVTRQMNPEDAGKVGHKLANAALIFATCCGLALLVAAFSYWR